MSDLEPVIGIDLGTTNSVVATVRDGVPRVIPNRSGQLLTPSIVAIAKNGKKLVGALAKLLMPGKDPGGWIVTTLLGIVGAVVGGFLGRLLGLYQEGEPAGFVGALLGAILVLWIYRKTRKAPAGA